MDIFAQFYETVITYFLFWWSWFLEIEWYFFLIVLYLIALPIILILTFLQGIFDFTSANIRKSLNGFNKKKEANVISDPKKDKPHYNFDDGSEITKIIQDFGEFIEKNPSIGLVHFDAKFLPHPKNIILKALLFGIKGTEDKGYKTTMETVLLVHLPYIQDDVGDKPFSLITDFDQPQKEEIDKNLEKYEELRKKTLKDKELYQMLLKKLNDNH